MTTGASAGVDPMPDLQSLYEDAPCGLLVTSVDGAIRRVNGTFCRWVGRPPEELLGLKLQDLLSVGSRIFHQTHSAPLLQVQGSVGEVKLDVVHRDGRIIHMVLNALRRSQGSEPFHEVAVFLAEDRHRYEQELLSARRDAEELLHKEQAAQRQLIEAKEEIEHQRELAQDRALFAEQMLAIVSHDLRNPLSVIRMSAYIIGLGDLSVQQRKALDRLSSSNARAVRLISDLLDFSSGRMGAGLAVAVRPVDLHTLIADSLEELRVAFAGRELIHRRAGSGRCSASSDRLVQLLGNLVSNAMTYGDPEAPVVVLSGIEADCFSIAVQNVGPLIDPALLPRLFDPMTRGADAESADHSVGMGLFIVREIARAHGGQVSVVSSPQTGTLFTAMFPRVDASEDSIVAEPPSTASSEEPEQRERLRQAELDRLDIDTADDAALDDITRLAAESFDVPIALISLIDGQRQWFKSRVGIQVIETPREHAFCAHAIQDAGHVMVVEDAAQDLRFATNPLVTGDPNIRFYAGAPLVTSSGQAIGTVCLIDTRPRTLDQKQLDTLQFLAQQAILKLEQR